MSNKSKGRRVRYTLRLPDILHERIRRAAGAAGQDLNTWINEMLERESGNG